MHTHSLVRAGGNLDVPRENITVLSRLFPLLFSALIFFTGCGGVNSSGDESGGKPLYITDLDSGGISGAVTSSASAAIDQAIVEAGNVQAITASNGTFLMLNLAAGDYRVTARAQGYTPSYRENVRVRSGIITEGVTLTMTDATATATRDFEVVSLSPAFGTDGDRISVVARGIGTTRGRVTVAGKDVSILDWNTGNNGVITVQLPAEVETGEVRVIIGGETSHEASPVIFTAKPVAREVVPTSSKPNGIVTLYGRNFHLVGASNRIRLNGLDCTVLGYTTAGRDLRIQLPAKAETGILDVSINSPEYQLDGISSVTITIQPELVHLSPRRSVPGKTLTLYGMNFVPDSSVTKVKVGDSKTVQGNEILSISKTKITFKAPEVNVVPSGQTVPIRVEVNGYTTNSIDWTSYDGTLTTLPVGEYGVYDFFNSTVANNGTLHLPALEPGEKLAFISVTGGTSAETLDGTYAWTFTGVMGGLTTDIPALPASRRLAGSAAGPVAAGRFRDVGPMLRSWYRKTSVRPSSRSVRPSVFDDAPATVNFWMVDFKSSAPENSANDVLATGTLAATGTHCLVYLDASGSALIASDAEKIAAWFDAIRPTLATACWDGVNAHQEYPEGNIDGQPRVILFLTPQINQGVTGGAVTLGYFHPRDKNPALAHSAGTEVIYLWDQWMKTNPDDFKGVLAHEFQHMMYHNQKGARGVDWLNEGLSVWAQQVAGYGFIQKMSTPVSQVALYLNGPNTASLNHWPEEGGLESYGLSYLFIQYLYERCGGYAAIRSLEYDNGQTGFTDLATSLLNNAVPATTGVEGFFNEFALAMYCDEIGLSASLPGFSAEAHRFRELSLRGWVSEVNGLKHLSYAESPVNAAALTIPGFAADVVEYDGNTSNGGDVEITVIAPPEVPNYKLWLIYYKP